METPNKVPFIVATPVAPVKRRRFGDDQAPVTLRESDIGRGTSNPWTALAETAHAEDALKRILAVAESMSLRFECAFLDSPEFRAALATYHAKRALAEAARLLEIASASDGSRM